MIYGPVFFAWVALSSHFAMLFLPAVSLVVRTSYLDRPLAKLVRLLPLAAGLLFFCYNVLILNMAVVPAGLFSAKMVLTGFVLVHLVLGARDIRVPTGKQQYGQHYIERALAAHYLAQRGLSLVWVRLGDIFHSVATRWRAPGARRLSIVMAGGQAAFTEMLLIKSEMQRTLAARGGFPTSLDWTVPVQRRELVVLGDLALFGLVGLFLWWDLLALVPREVLSLSPIVTGPNQ